MPKYNPNSIWGSPKKDASPASAARPAPAAPVARPSRPAAPSSKPTQTQKATPVKTLPARSMDDMEPPKNHFLLWGIIIFVVVVGGGVFALIFFRPQVGPNVSIDFNKPDQVLVGDPFHFSISLSNNSQNILKDTILSINLPSNVAFVGQSPDQKRAEDSIGDLGPGSIYQYNGNKDKNLIVTGDPSSVKHITVKLTYATNASSKTRFATEGEADLSVGGPAISLNIITPASVFSGQDFTTNITYNNNTNHSFNNVALTLRYPPAFSFKGSSVPADGPGNNVWNLGTISAAGSGNIIINGGVVGPENASYALNGAFTGSVMGNTYQLSQGSANFSIGSSPLSLSISLNDSRDYIAETNDGLNYVITYKNNSNVTFQNAVIKATLIGSMFDLSSLGTNGSFNSINNTITWFPGNTPDLLAIEPGSSGSVEFRIRTQSSYPIKRLSDKNFTLNLRAQISSVTVPPGTAASSTISVTELENKVVGKTILASKGYWRDAPSGILNAGPYPPVVNQTTQYTIHWIITNYSNDAQNAELSATLQSGTTCTGEMKSNAPTAPSCDPATGRVTWSIPFVPATIGVLGAPYEAIFQVQNTPAINQVGSDVALLSETSLTAMDAFTSSTLESSAPAVTTALPDDKTLSPAQSRTVTQ